MVRLQMLLASIAVAAVNGEDCDLNKDNRDAVICGGKTFLEDYEPKKEGGLDAFGDSNCWDSANHCRKESNDKDCDLTKRPEATRCAKMVREKIHEI